MRKLYRGPVIVLLCALLIQLACGCAMEKIRLLKSLAQDEKEKEAYINKQTGGFLKLQKDISGGKLKEGLSKQEVVGAYGEPVLCSAAQAEPNAERCLFRRPVEFFNTDKVFIFFDEQERLVAWESYPAAKKD